MEEIYKHTTQKYNVHLCTNMLLHRIPPCMYFCHKEGKVYHKFRIKIDVKTKVML